MLKALELAGFKSFADKTRFEFPPGITVVVGPNGSGKSNIVDAIKWVLGEQSAKSLRGKEMADVIFKGSGTAGRKPANAAEATIVFDNSEGRLAIDAQEVHVTRRVYRSGEGEYLINRQPCRLKDVRDLFRGTGVGTDAYSLIEQGRVDRLLQASARDRRAIFEEAAGISRFKAKKIEAQRRLERVEQNLVRLKDIVDEVDQRVRSLRNQASKARRYREHTERLQQLRTHVGLADWRRLTARLTELEQELVTLLQQQSSQQGENEKLEACLLEHETAIGVASESIRACESREGKNREQIAARESSVEHERARCHELEGQLHRHQRQLAALTTRAGSLQGQLRDAEQGVLQAAREHAAFADVLATHEAAQAEVAATLESLRGTIAGRRRTHLDQTGRLAEVRSRTGTLEADQATAAATIQRVQELLSELDETCRLAREELDQARAEESRLVALQAASEAELELAQRELAENRRILSRRQEEQAVQQGRLGGLSERASLLDELERKQEGLTEGVTQVLALWKQDPSGPFSGVRGMVADVIRANLEMAPLIDAALGQRAQHVLVTDDRIVGLLRDGGFRAQGRVGFIFLDEPASLAAHHVFGEQAGARETAPAGQTGAGESEASGSGAVGRSAVAAPMDFTGRPGVLGRADSMVETAPEFRPLVSWLLGTTWFVQSVDDALVLRRSHSDAAPRFVTAAGEILEPDGTLVVGPRRASLGLVSRRTELRALKRELGVLRECIDEAQQEITRLQENIEQQERTLLRVTDESRQRTAAVTEQRVTMRTCQERAEQLGRQRERLESEINVAEATRARAAAEWDVSRGLQASLEQELETMRIALAEDERLAEELEAARRDRLQAASAARVELTRSEQQLEAQRLRCLQFQEDQRERDRVIETTRAQSADCLEKHDQTQRRILETTGELAELYLLKEREQAAIRAHMATREQATSARGAMASELQRLRQTMRQRELRQHELDLAASEVRLERTTMAQRLREDYGLEIAQVEADFADPSQSRDEIEKQIADLRRKIHALGAVNMEALDELDDLEARYQSLSTQYEDLKQAKEALQRIIQRIDTDSRRLFTDTLEAIRVNFQGLYRQAFGGGRADLMLEEGVDVLEAGVEIVATPPGKPSFNNSLLSGGEKALTAVALLLAIFQFRPSPFCVLDEVDAPFDEANIGRFVSVLKEFLTWTKFVIVTHSKKTMTAATTLYGVTMQESGVSKQVSVRFEDVSDDGQIRAEAIERTEETARKASA